MRTKAPITVGFVALGCPKNVVDSEKMLAEIAQAGFLITDDPDNADVVIINTCGFIAPAKAEAVDVIRHAIACKRKGTVKKVIVAGCLSQRLGKKLFDEVDGIDAIVGLGQRDSIAAAIKKSLKSTHPSSYMAKSANIISDDRTRLRIGAPHRAYLRISEGCDHDCSFCTIPAIRGKFRSKPQQAISAEAAELVSSGAVELNIIAQDTAYYGKDLKIKDGLAKLLPELEKIEGLKWIRLMYLYPVGITDRLIETIASGEKIVHYFDIPIQHINNDILKAMHRPDSKKRICSLIEKLRLAIPDVILRTTVIVGFPGETDDQFSELLEFIKWADIDALGCFTYYPEEGTIAAEMKCQISDSVKQQRMDRLMLTQQQIAFAKNKKRIGSRFTCLVDSVDEHTAGRGRFYGQAPEIDSICIIRNCSAIPGDFIETQVIDASGYDLIVEQIYLHAHLEPKKPLVSNAQNKK